MKMTRKIKEITNAPLQVKSIHLFLDTRSQSIKLKVHNGKKYIAYFIIPIIEIYNENSFIQQSPVPKRNYMLSVSLKHLCKEFLVSILLGTHLQRKLNTSKERK